MKESLELMGNGIINPAAMITHVGGLNAVVEATKNLPNIKGGKKLIYTNVEMELTAIADFAEKGKTDPFFAELAELTAKHNNLWNLEAEKALLKHFNVTVTEK